MAPYSPHKRQFRIVLAILLLAMLFDRYVVSQAAPGLSGLLGITPMVVFLDIPADLPFTFGIIPVLTLFTLLYTASCFPYHSPNKVLAWRWMKHRLYTVLTALMLIPLWVLSGGLAYSLAHDSLPKHLRNAIESFGIDADIYSPYPGHERIHLRGSMIMLACFFVGARGCIRRIRRAVPFVDPMADLITDPITGPIVNRIPLPIPVAVPMPVPAPIHAPIPVGVHVSNQPNRPDQNAVLARDRHEQDRIARGRVPHHRVPSDLFSYDHIHGEIFSQDHPHAGFLPTDRAVTDSLLSDRANGDSPFSISTT
jgi:hypothetical protein